MQTERREGRHFTGRRKKTEQVKNERKKKTERSEKKNAQERKCKCYEKLKRKGRGGEGTEYMECCDEYQNKKMRIKDNHKEMKHWRGEGRGDVYVM